MTYREKPARTETYKLFQSVGEYDKAKEYLEQTLSIIIQIGDKEGEASSYGNLGAVFLSLGEYDKAKGYLEKALATQTEIGDKEGEALLIRKLRNCVSVCW